MNDGLITGRGRKWKGRAEERRGEGGGGGERGEEREDCKMESSVSVCSGD